MEVDFDLLGIAELQRALNALRDDVAQRIVKESVAEGAEIIYEAAKTACPVGETGVLKASINIKKGRVNAATGAITYSVKTGDDFFVGKSYYGGMIEYGTSRMEAKPFMRPAYDNNVERVVEVMVANMNEQIKEAQAQLG